MKAIVMMVALALTTGTLLSACIVVPARGWHGERRGWHHPHYYAPRPHRHWR